MFRSLVAVLALASPCAAQEISVGDLLPDLTALTNPTIAGFEYFGEGRPNLNISMAPNAAFNLEIIVEETGFLDDSVEGRRGVYELTYTADGWEVLQAAVQFRCRRGDNLDWQTGLCP